MIAYEEKERKYFYKGNPNSFFSKYLISNALLILMIFISIESIKTSNQLFNYDRNALFFNAFSTLTLITGTILFLVVNLFMINNLLLQKEIHIDIQNQIVVLRTSIFRLLQFTNKIPLKEFRTVTLRYFKQAKGKKIFLEHKNNRKMLFIGFYTDRNQEKFNSNSFIDDIETYFARN